MLLWARHYSKNLIYINNTILTQTSQMKGTIPHNTALTSHSNKLEGFQATLHF